MRRLTRNQLDSSLRDEIKEMWGRTPGQTWLKPVAVTPVGSDQLVFVLHTFREEPPLQAAPVRPSRDILERFLRLVDAPAAKIHEFASKFGPLLIFCEVDAFSLPNQLVITERCEIWRYVAASMTALLRIAASFHTGCRPDLSNWERIGNRPASLVPAHREHYDPLNPVSWSGEEAFVAMTHFVRQGSDRDRKMWTRLLNSFLELGRVRPWVVWEGSGSSARPKLVFSGPSLLSYLVLQLCLMASKHDAFAVCSYCSREYTPRLRAPKAGQRNFCPDCRDRGVPLKLAQRQRRERLRQAVAATASTRGKTSAQRDHDVGNNANLTREN